MTEHGHPQPLLDNQGEGDLFTGQLPEAVPEPIIDEQTTLETVSEAPIPLDQVAAAHAQRQAEYHKRKEKLERSNWPPGRIAEKLDAEFPDQRSPERIEELAKRENAALRRQARRNPPKPNRRTVRYISPRDTGPPPYIAKEIRGE